MDVKASKMTCPKSVLSLYLKLFCKRRNTDKNKMLEGIQSWLTLSKSEKQHFFNKYKECRLNHKVKLANYLTKVQPYLKKKSVFSNRTTKNIRKEEVTKLETVEVSGNESEEHCHLDTDHHEISVNDEMINYNVHPTLESIPQIKGSLKRIEQLRPVLAEPTPPSVRSGKELFEMLQATSTSEDTNHESWAMLPNLQKNRYQRAVQLLKNDYIRKYKSYLEGLSSKELFHCYNNAFD